MSIILRPDLSPSEAPILTLAGGLAVIRAMDSHGLKGNLKWPNDVLLEDKKVCGILTEMSGEMDRIEYIVMGIGINANFDMGELPSGLRDRVTTLQEAVGSPVNRKRLLADVLAEFEALYESDGAEVLANWKGRSSTMGRRVRVRTQRTDIEGVAVDLTSSGALVIELDSGERRTVLSGDCIYLKKD